MTDKEANGERPPSAPPSRPLRRRVVVEVVATDEQGNALPEESGPPSPAVPTSNPPSAEPKQRAVGETAPRRLPRLTITDLRAYVRAHLDLLALAAILLFAFAIRIINLGSFPDTFMPDEADNTQSALRIIHGVPPDNGFFGFDWKPQPAFSVYMLSVFLRIFGVSIFAARLPSAIISVLALIPFYLLLRRQFSIVSSLLTVFLLATNLWYLNFSRSTWENVHICFYMLMAMLFLLLALDGLRKKSVSISRVWLYFGISGFFCTLGLYGYFAGRAIILAFIVYFPIVLWFYRRRWRQLLWGYLIIIAVAAILISPQLIYTLKHWDTFNLRTQAVLISNTPEFRANPLGTLTSQVGKNITGIWFADNNPLNAYGYSFYYYTNARYVPNAQPYLDPITGVLVFVGMILSLALARLRRRPETYLWWVMLLVCWAFTEVVTFPTPNGARGVGWMPTLFFFVATALEAIVILAAQIRVRPWLPLATTTLAVIIVGFSSIATYVNWQNQPDSRFQRAPYIATCVFDDWKNQIIALADAHKDGFTVSDWLARHPQPQGFSILPCDQNGNSTALTVGPLTSPTAGPVVPGATAVPTIAFIPPATPRQQWPTFVATVGKGAAAHQGGLLQPRAVAVDKAGNIYVADSDPKAQSITKYDASGKFLLTWGGPGSADDNAKFADLWAIAVDKAGEVLALDEATEWVQVFDANGKFLRKWGGLPSKMYHPRAMTIDANDSIYIADTGNHRILVYDTNGTLERELADKAAGIPDTEQVTEPSGVASGSAGFYVADAKAQLLRSYSTAGRQQTSWGFASVDAINGPRLALAPDGSLYATAMPLCSLVHFDANGIALDSAGSCANKDYLSQPSGLTIAGNKLYVTDLAQKAVLIFNLPATNPSKATLSTTPAAP